jgi:hypothetical protein
MKLEHIQAIMLVIDAGIRAGGLQVFIDGRGRALQDALDTLQQMAQAAEDKEKTDGGNADDDARG